MKLHLEAELKVIESHRIIRDGRLRGGSKTISNGYKVVIEVAGVYAHEMPGYILLAGPYPTRKEADDAMARLAAERFTNRT